jgi:hypothetical protein
MIHHLLVTAGLLGIVGRILFIDNWYTSIDVVSHVWMYFGIFVVGTIVLTKKKSKGWR